MAEDLGERTEEPTPKRLEEARREGNIPRSQELSGAAMLLGATLLVAAVFVPTLDRFRGLMLAVLGDDALGSPVAPDSAEAVIAFVAAATARITIPLLLVLAAISFLVQFGQIGWLFSPKVVAPKLSHLDPLAGLRKLFGAQNLFKAGLSVVKLAIVVAIVVLTVYQYRRDILVLAWLSPVQGTGKAGLMLLDLALRLVAVLLLVGLLDYLFQRWKHRRDLRMTRHQVKEELKQSEGDPQVKSRRARMAHEIAMQRINSAVPKADVIVTNPEHISIAIRYDADEMNAPTVVAKGADFLALRIRQIALLREIPIVERPPLARALYRQVAVGREIPPDFYHAVAEILAFVYRLREGRAAG